MRLSAMFEICDPRPLPNIERGLDPIVAFQEVDIVDHTGAFRPAALGQRRARAAHGRDRFVSQALAQLAFDDEAYSCARSRCRVISSSTRRSRFKIMTVCNARLANRETVFRSATALQNTMNFSFEVSKNCLK